MRQMILKFLERAFQHDIERALRAQEKWRTSRYADMQAHAEANRWFDSAHVRGQQMAALRGVR